MKISILKISIALTVIGIAWLGIITIDSHGLTENLVLDVAQTDSIEFDITGDIGFYRISLPDLGNIVFVQILDSSGNIISDKKLETKVSINYFDVNQDKTYVLKITNIGKNFIPIEIQIGQFNTEELRYPGAILMAGVLLMITLGFFRLKNYKIAQPDENTS